MSIPISGDYTYLCSSETSYQRSNLVPGGYGQTKKIHLHLVTLEVIMNVDTEIVSMRLELIAAKAKQLASDVKNHKLWEGDLQKGICELQEQLTQVSNEARTDR
jgi:hypothetical protein